MSYDRGQQPVELPNAEHLALVLVLDVSASMNAPAGGSTCISLLNKGVNDMITALSNNPATSKYVDLAIVTFGERAKVYQDFAPISQVSPVNLIANQGRTLVAQAINMALNKARDRTNRYTGGAWKPWIVLITDGEFHDDITSVPSNLDSSMSVADCVRDRENKGKLRTFALGVGNDFNPQQLKIFTDRAFQIEGYNLAEFFNWLGKSVAVVSQSATSSGAGYGVTNAPPVPMPSNKDPNNPTQNIFNQATGVVNM